MRTQDLIVALLGVLFVGLKLTSHIDWSWWLVLLPFYGPLALAGVILVAIFIFTILKGGRK